MPFTSPYDITGPQLSHHSNVFNFQLRYIRGFFIKDSKLATSLGHGLVITSTSNIGM